MALRVEAFGGLRPALKPRELPPDAAQTASNLFARSRAFWPLPQDVAAGTASTSDPATLFRYRGSFLSSAIRLSFALGQVAGDTTDRAYFTFDDGSAPPRAIDSTATLTNLSTAGRRLGVPAPTTAPAVVLQTSDELTPEELPGVDADAVRAITDAVNASFTSSYQCNAIAAATPSSSQLGWAPHGAGMPSVAEHQWNLLVPMNGAVPAPGFEYLQRTEFGGMQVSVSAVSYWAVPFELFAPVKTINTSALTTALTALNQPHDAAQDLFEAGEVTSVVSNIAAYYSLTNEPMKSMLDAAKAATALIRSVIDQTEDGIPAAFFASTTWTDAINGVVGINTTTEKGAAAERIAFQATKMATTNPITGAAESISPTATRYWPETAGTTTQYANIRSDINSCITTNSLGQKEFDVGKLKNILAVEFEDIIVERAAGQRPALRASLPDLIDYCVQPLVELFSPGNLLALNRQAQTDVGSALLSARDGAKVALNRLRDLYTDRVAQAEQAARNAYALGAQQRIAEQAQTRIVDSRA